MKRFCLLAVLLALAAGCGQRSDIPRVDRRPGEPNVPVAGLSFEGLKYLAAEEPADAKGVIDLRKDAKEGDDVVIVGRIGGSKHPVVQGRAAFTIVDLSLKSCDDDPNCYDFA
jgi:hypothetical protein